MKDKQPFVKKLLSIFFRVGISIFLLWILFRRLDKGALVEICRSADKGFIVAAFLIFFIAYIFGVFRWRMLLKAANINLPIKRIIISIAGGNFFSLFLPSTIGGDVVRVIDLTSHTRRPHEVMATVFLDRLSGYAGLVITAWIGLLFGAKFLSDTSIVIPVAAITALLIAILLVLFNNFFYTRVSRLLHSPSDSKVKHYLRDVHKEIHIFRKHKKIGFQNLLLSIAIQMVPPVTFYLTALSLGLKIKLIYFLVYMPLVGAVTLLPISIGGLGLREYTTALFFGNSHINAHSIFAMSFLNSLFILIYGCIGGLIYVFTLHHRRIQSRSSSAVRKAHK